MEIVIKLEEIVQCPKTHLQILYLTPQAAGSVELCKQKRHDQNFKKALCVILRPLSFPLMLFKLLSTFQCLCLPACVKTCLGDSGLLLASWSMAHPIIFTFYHNKPLFTNFAVCSQASLQTPPPWVYKLLEGRGHGLSAYYIPSVSRHLANDVPATNMLNR